MPNIRSSAARLRLFLALFFCIVAVPVSDVFADDAFVAPEPEDLVLYMLMIDRFDNGDPSNDRANPRSTLNPSGGASFHGGDFAGVERRLDYLATLGVNGIWLSPVLQNVDDYHGYGTFDWYATEPNFGTKAELVSLIEAANERGIAVYLDMVAGHCSNIVTPDFDGPANFRPPPATYDMKWRTDSLRYPPPFDRLDFFHAHGGMDRSRVGEVVGDLAGLDDLKTETPEVREAMRAIWLHWLEELPLSGFRIDTVKHVDREFWEDFLPALRSRAEELGRSNYYTFGEIYGGDDAFMSDYIGTLDGGPYKLDAAVDFQYYYAAREVFAKRAQPPSTLSGRLQRRAEALGAHHLKMPNFFDNHDVVRFLTEGLNDTEDSLTDVLLRRDLALVHLMTSPGPPIIYYGTEQSFQGAHDPNNRQDMFDGEYESGPAIGDNFDESHTTYRFVRRLTTLRHALPALRRGGLESIVATGNGPGLLSYLRTHESGDVLVIMNTHDGLQTHPAIELGWPAGLELVNALDPSQRVTVGADGSWPARALARYTAEVWVPIKELPAGRPEVLLLAPADGETGVETSRAIVVTFSTPMAHMETERAVTIEPSIATTASWDATSRQLTMVPNSALAPGANYTVSVDRSIARNADGDPLDFGESASWETKPEPKPLPEPPELIGLLTPMSRTITIDGIGDEWDFVPSQLPDDTNILRGAEMFARRDSLSDDVGDGDYTYPTADVFTGGEADLREFRFAFDREYCYFYVEVASVSATADWFTPYIGIALDVAPGGSTSSLGYDLDENLRGIAELTVRPDFAREYELVFTGPRGACIIDSAGRPLATNTPGIDRLTSAYSKENASLEIRVPRELLALDDLAEPRRVAFVVYAGLETYGGLRELQETNSQWLPGGGVPANYEPDVFDLMGATPEEQQAELGESYSSQPAMVTRSIIRLVLRE